MPKKNATPGQPGRPGGKKAPEEMAAVKKDKGVPRSYLEYRRTSSARDFLSKDPAGLNLTKLVNHLIQEHAKSKGWVCPEEMANDDI